MHQGGRQPASGPDLQSAFRGGQKRIPDHTVRICEKFNFFITFFYFFILYLFIYLFFCLFIYLFIYLFSMPFDSNPVETCIF